MRSLEDHLSPHELASLPGSPDASSTGAPGQSLDQLRILQHLQQCEECSEMANAYRSLRGTGEAGKTVGPSDECPAMEVWLQLASGQIPERSEELLRHAAGCDACGADLKEAMELMGPDQIDEVSEPIEGLESTRPEWQRRLGAKMAAATIPDAPAVPTNLIAMPKRRIPLWLAYPVAAVLLLGATMLGVDAWRTANPSDAQLLAMAYNKQRTLALRIPGADPVPMATGTRGDGDTPVHGLNDTTELTELKLRAQKQLDRTPNSPYWHQIMGEIQLQQQDGYGARRNLEIAQIADENLPNLQQDLAAAWFEIGIQSDNTESFAEAAELYSKELHRKDIQQHPEVAALLYYNRALCWERQSLTENALDDLHAALAVEKSAAWRKTIEAEIARLSNHAATNGNDGYEAALDEATSKLLPLWSSSPEARQKIKQTAELGLKHHDRWLQDWIKFPHTDKAQEADRHLAAAIADGAAGEPELSLSESRHAIALYQESMQTPGLLRAKLAEAYALQRLIRTKECLSNLNQMIGSPHLQDYSWLEVRSLEEDVDCPGGTGNFDGRLRLLNRALQLSSDYDLIMLNLRAQAEQAEAAESKGLRHQTWKMVAGALQRCQSVQCPSSTRFPLLYLLVDGAISLHLPNVGAEVMRTATIVAAETGNVRTQSYSLETLGILNGRIGDFKASNEAFKLASEVAHSGNHDHLAPSAEADWQTDRAEILLRQGLSGAALNLLQQNGSPILQSEYVVGRLHYLTQLAATQRALGHNNDALASAWGAVHEAELALPSLASSNDRERWQEANRGSYSELVAAYLELGDPTKALEAWERFRTAPYKTPRTEDVASDDRGTDQPAAQALIVAHVSDEYVVWLAKVAPLSSVQVLRIPNGDRLQQTAAIFFRLCSDSKSSVADIRAVGRLLYASLFEPFRKQVSSTDQLWIEPDQSLVMLPFAALTTSNGAWLGETSEVTILPAWWTLSPQGSLQETLVPISAHMLAVSGFGNTETDQSEVQELASSFDRPTILRGATATPEAMLHELPNTEVFHFSGHASSNNDPGFRLPGGRVVAPDTLSSVHLSRCRLSVLAACSTAAQDPAQVETTPDLRDALLLAGSRSVIASNWDVDDQSTRALMSALYKSLAVGLSTTQSLKVAQQQVHSSNNWQHPYYWASFEVFTH